MTHRQVVIDQQAMIDQLNKHVAALSRRVLELSDFMAQPDGGSEKPPHY